MDLRNLIDDTHLDLARLEKVLDELGHGLASGPSSSGPAGTWPRSGRPPRVCTALTLDDFVPSSAGPLVEVIHHGKNSLPAHNYFQKRFCKPKSEETKDQLLGLQRADLGRASPAPGITSPIPPPRRARSTSTTRWLPKEKPAAWPGIVPNSVRLGRFVYYGMIDVMRGISSHVSIGRAKKKHGWMDAWFVLVREDLPEPSQPTS